MELEGLPDFLFGFIHTEKVVLALLDKLGPQDFEAAWIQVVFVCSLRLPALQRPEMFHLIKRVPLMARAFFAYKRGASTVGYSPLHLWVDPTDLCNLRCVMCPTQRPGVRDKGFMDFDLFKKILNEARSSFPIVNLYMSGESFMHKQIFEMIDYAANCIYTNATFLDDEKCHQILDSRLDWLGFSFDGYDRESYERIRVRGKFDEVTANMERFLRFRKERKQRTPHTYLSLVELPELAAMPQEVKDAFKKRLFDAGIDQFEVSPAHNWAGQVNEFVQIEVGPQKPASANYTVCPAPWTMMAILWDGTAVPCCLDTAAQYPLGNAVDSTLMELFNGDRMQSLRRKLADGDGMQLDLCRDCSHLRDKQYFGIPSKVWVEVRDNLLAALPSFKAR